MPRFMHKDNSARIRVAGAMLCVLLLCGCGIKPGHPEAPNASSPDTFPRTYPAPD